MVWLVVGLLYEGSTAFGWSENWSKKNEMVNCYIYDFLLLTFRAFALLFSIAPVISCGSLLLPSPYPYQMLSISWDAIGPNE